MRKKTLDLLTANDRHIQAYVRDHENLYSYCDEILYKRCIKDIRRRKLCDFGVKEIRGPIHVFLINWGNMGRVLGRKDCKHWEDGLLRILPKIGDDFERLRPLDLAKVDLDEYKEKIIKYYKQFEKVLKPTATSKLLHSTAPEFFPMWDQGVRGNVKENCTPLKIGVNPEGYYNFMVSIQKFVKNHDRVISKLSKQHGKSKLRIADAYLWKASRKR
jgi:hypothetical protein